MGGAHPPPAMGGGLFGANTGGGLFGGQQSAGGSPFGGGPASDESPSGPATPQVLLDSSGYMRWGQEEDVVAAAARGIRALKYLAGSASAPGGAPSPQAAQEDPLVANLLGGFSGPTPGPNASVHIGFVCDGSQVNPIVGTRFKATSAFDIDLTEACRRSGNFAGGAGFRPVPTGAEAMRWALTAALEWWPLLWPGRDDLFGASPPNLMDLQLQGLSRAIINLPDHPTGSIIDLLA